eukprot:g5999.t1
MAHLNIRAGAPETQLSVLNAYARVIAYNGGEEGLGFEIANVLNVDDGPWRTDGLIHASKPNLRRILRKPFPDVPEALPLSNYNFGVYETEDDEKAREREKNGMMQPWENESAHFVNAVTGKPWRRKGLNYDLLLATSENVAISHLVISSPRWCDNAAMTGLVWIWDKPPPELESAEKEYIQKMKELEMEELDARAAVVELGKTENENQTHSGDFVNVKQAQAFVDALAERQDSAKRKMLEQIFRYGSSFNDFTEERFAVMHIKPPLTEEELAALEAERLRKEQAELKRREDRRLREERERKAREEKERLLAEERERHRLALSRFEDVEKDVADICADPARRRTMWESIDDDDNGSLEYDEVETYVRNRWNLLQHRLGLFRGFARTPLQHDWVEEEELRVVLCNMCTFGQCYALFEVPDEIQIHEEKKHLQRIEEAKKEVEKNEELLAKVKKNLSRAKKARAGPSKMKRLKELVGDAEDDLSEAKRLLGLAEQPLSKPSRDEMEAMVEAARKAKERGGMESFRLNFKDFMKACPRVGIEFTPAEAKEAFDSIETSLLVEEFVPKKLLEPPPPPSEEELLKKAKKRAAAKAKRAKERIRQGEDPSGSLSSSDDESDRDDKQLAYMREFEELQRREQIIARHKVICFDDFCLWLSSRKIKIIDKNELGIDGSESDEGELISDAMMRKEREEEEALEREKERLHRIYQPSDSPCTKCGAQACFVQENMQCCSCNYIEVKEERRAIAFENGDPDPYGSDSDDESNKTRDMTVPVAFFRTALRSRQVEIPIHFLQAKYIHIKFIETHGDQTQLQVGKVAVIGMREVQFGEVEAATRRLQKWWTQLITKIRWMRAVSSANALSKGKELPAHLQKDANAGRVPACLRATEALLRREANTFDSSLGYHLNQSHCVILLVQNADVKKKMRALEAFQAFAKRYYDGTNYYKLASLELIEEWGGIIEDESGNDRLNTSRSRSSSPTFRSRSVTGRKSPTSSRNRPDSQMGDSTTSDFLTPDEIALREEKRAAALERAKRKAAKLPTIFFFVCDDRDGLSAGIAETFGVSVTPRLLAINPNRDKYILPEEVALNERNIFEFVRGFVYNEFPPRQLSGGGVLTENTGAMVKLTTKVFKDFVLQEDKDVFVLLVTKSCPRAVRARRTVRLLAWLLRDVTTLRIGVFDIEENDLPLDFHPPTREEESIPVRSKSRRAGSAKENDEGKKELNDSSATSGGAGAIESKGVIVRRKRDIDERPKGSIYRYIPKLNGVPQCLIYKPKAKDKPVVFHRGSFTFANLLTFLGKKCNSRFNPAALIRKSVRLRERENVLQKAKWQLRSRDEDIELLNKSFEDSRDENRMKGGDAKAARKAHERYIRETIEFTKPAYDALQERIDEVESQVNNKEVIVTAAIVPADLIKSTSNLRHVCSELHAKATKIRWGAVEEVDDEKKLARRIRDAPNGKPIFVAFLRPDFVQDIASLKMLPIYVEQSRNFPKATYLTCDAETCRRVCTIFDICAIPAMAAFKNNKLLYKAEGASTTTWQQCAIDVAVDEGWVK